MAQLTKPARELDVRSEVGRLRQVILHRPDLELKRLTPANMDELLFDDVLWVKRAREEHDAFADALRDHGVVVHLLGNLLRETLEIVEARKYVLDHILDERAHGPLAIDTLREFFESQEPDELTEVFIGGLTKRELLEQVAEPNSVALHVMDPDEFVLWPLPNHVYTRDTSCWIYDGVSINSMRWKARRRETVHYEAIYRWHPMFAGSDFNLWSEGTADGRATIEGGDVLVIGRGAVPAAIAAR